LKMRINTYFGAQGKLRTGDWRIILKAVILLVSLSIIYTLLVVVQPHWAVGTLLCVVLGINLAAIGFNIMHDAGHNSFSRSKKVNTLLSYTLNLVGGNIYFWKLKHNIAHHTYTNIDGEDHDIEVKFMRIHHDQQLKKHHRYQSFYFILLYGVSYLAWIFYHDYEKNFRQKMGATADKFHFPLRERVIFWTSKILHFAVFVVVPIIYVGWLPTLIGWIIAGAICGISLATVFQLAHVVSGTEFKTI